GHLPTSPPMLRAVLVSRSSLLRRAGFRGGTEFSQELRQHRIRSVAVSDQILSGRVVIITEQAFAVLHALPPCIDLLLEDVRRSQALTVGIGKNVEAISVYIQSGLIGNRERAEEAESKAEGCAHDGVDVLSSGHAFLDDRGGFFEEHILQSVQHHSWCICHLRTLVTRLCQHFLDG